MEWKLLSDEDSEDFVELDTKEIVLEDTSEEEEVVVVVSRKPKNPRRAIEILREQKQLEEETWDCFEQ